MPRIRFELLDKAEGHECRCQCSKLLKGAMDSNPLKAVEIGGDSTLACQGPPDGQPRCDAPGRKYPGGEDLARDCGLPLPGCLLEEQQVEAGSLHAAFVCHPCKVLGDDKAPHAVDQGQADGNEGLTEGDVKLCGPVLPLCDPDAVAGGGKEPAGDDSGQVRGREGSIRDAVKFSFDAEPPGHAAVSWVWLSPGAGTPEAALTGLSPG